MTTKMVFHGSDIEKICAYYHLNKEDTTAEAGSCSLIS